MGELKVNTDTSPIKRFNPFMGEYANRLYTNTIKHTDVTLNLEDKSTALRGMIFTQPDLLPDGFNKCPNGTNLLSKYIPNAETGELMPDMPTQMFVA